MAIFTACAQGLLVGIIFRVTRDAAGVHIFKSAAQMAFFTTDRGMHPDQGKDAQVMVKTDILCPPLFIVTGGAIVQLPPMHVVCHMACRARRIELRVAGIIFMTGLAVGLPVASPQRKLGIFIVIKRDFGPSGCGMTFITACSVSSLMNIIRQMTVDTIFTGLNFKQ